MLNKEQHNIVRNNGKNWSSIIGRVLNNADETPISTTLT